MYFLVLLFQFALSSFAAPTLTCMYLDPVEKLFLVQHFKYASRSSDLETKAVDQYIKKLDPTKIYFLQSDAEQIKQKLAGLTKKLEQKDCENFNEVQKILVTRVKERRDFVKEMLGSSYKFDSNVEFAFDPSHKSYPATQKEAEEFLRKYIHFQVSNYLITDMKLSEAKANVLKFWDRAVKRLEEVKQEDVFANYLDAFANALDPHSSFMSTDNNEDFRIQMSLSLEGIGATLSSQDGFTVIEYLVPGGSAARSGLLQPQDKIIAVGQATGPMENVIEIELRDVVKKIRGPKGSVVRLLILRKEAKGTKRETVTLVRDKIKLEDDAASITYIDRTINGVKKKIGLVNLPSFYNDGRRGGRSSSSDMKKLLQEANRQGVDGIVLDLSTNGGGSLEDAVKISGLFFKTGNVVRQSSRENIRPAITLADMDPAVDWAGPLVILTSRVTASASEIVSGTLKDYRRAVIIGSDHTFGKGSVQTVMDIPPNSGALGAMKVTVGMFYIPSGYSTQNRGVESDLVIPSSFYGDEVGEKYLDYALPESKINSFLSPDAYVKEGPGAWKMVDSQWIKSLQEKSKVRVSKSAEFKKIIDEQEKAKARGKVISLAEIMRDKDSKKEKKSKSKLTRNGSKAEREKEYLKRADIQESVDVLLDLIAIDNSKQLANK